MNRKENWKSKSEFEVSTNSTDNQPEGKDTVEENTEEYHCTIESDKETVQKRPQTKCIPQHDM
jgi:hypothetical protein